MVMFLIFSLIGSWVSVGAEHPVPPEITVLEADLDHAVVQVDISGYDFEQFSGYSRFSVPGYTTDTGVLPGQPEFPLVSVVLGLPAGMQPVVSGVDVDWVPAGSGTPYPMQPPRTDDQVEPFFFVDISSDLNGIYPGESVALFQPGNWAGVNTVVLQFNPFSWDATTGEFRVASSMTARVDFQGDAGTQVALRPEIANMLSSKIVNYDALGIPVDSSPVSEDDVVYICVVPPENLDSITPFLAMVNSLGHHVKIIEMPEGSTSYAIKAAISAEYQAGVTRFALIPARHQQLESKDYGSFVGDFYYELMDSDNLPDLAVGRFPASSTHLPNQASKVMSYVTYQGVAGQPSISASVVLAAHEENYPNKYTANSNAVKNWDYELADPVFETVYPPEGGTPDDVSAAINSGVGIVNYRGHGSNTTWQWQGSWNAGDIYALTNTFVPPVFNVCCNNGAHNYVYNCLCESWLDAPAGIGASGTLGASTSSYTDANNRFQKVLFWQLFDEGNTCAGEMFAAAQADIVQTQPGLGLPNARMYHWFGDPSMDIPNSDLPGTPFALDFAVPSSLNPGPNTLYLTVTSGGNPVEGVVVTVTDGIGNHPAYSESFYEQQITNSSGEVWLNFTAEEGKTLYYGARKHNFASVTGTIDVVSTGISGTEPQSVGLSPVSPSPVRGMADISYTAPVSNHVNISVLDLAGRVVAVLVDGPATAGNGAVQFSTSEITPGIYFVVMQSGETTITRKMAVVR